MKLPGEQQEQLAQAFAAAPPLAGKSPADFEITRLEGYTNHNLRLLGPDEDWVLRLPRPQTNRFIDRHAEAHNQGLAHRLGIAPAVAWRDAGGMSLTATLAGSRALDAADLDSDRRLEAIVAPFQQLHRSGLRFRGGRDLRGTLEQHYALLDTPGQEALATRMETARRQLALLDLVDAPPVASHRDPVPANLLMVGERLWLIDWEYAAMASPYWDLAILCNELELDSVQSRRLWRAYCVGGPAMKESLLFEYRELLELLNDCWMAALAE